MATTNDAEILDTMQEGWFLTVAYALDDLGLIPSDTPTRAQRAQLARVTGLNHADISRAIRIRRLAASMEAE